MKTISSLVSLWLGLLVAAMQALAVQPNTPPVISAIPDQFTNEDVPILNIPFTVWDAETPADKLRLEWTVVKPDGPLLHDNVVVSGTSTSRWLSLRPRADTFGTNLITLRATDAGGLTGSTSFGVKVVPVNAPPRLSVIADQTIIVGTTLVVAFTVSDPDNSPLSLKLSATSSRQSVVKDSVLGVRASSLTNRILENFTPLMTPGSTAISVEASDGKARARTAFILTVVPAAFEKAPATLPGAIVQQPAWGDFDANGSLDLLVPAREILFNNGSGLLSNGLTLGTAPTSTRAALADYDGDGYLDILLFGGGTRLYRNTVRGRTFTTPTAINQALLSTTSAAWADLDGDGDLDLIISGPGGTQWLRNEGNDQFTSMTGGLEGTYGLLATADYDNDGSPDVLVASEQGGGIPLVRLYHNDGTGFFTDSRLGLPQQPTAAGGWVDVNGDGRFDLWLVQSAGPSWNRTNSLIVLTQERGTFVEAFRLPGEIFGKTPQIIGATTNLPVWADFDNDGFIDFVGPALIGLNGTNIPVAALYHNDAHGHFSTAGVPVAVNFGQATAEPADFDGDGSVDLISRLFGGLRAFRNQERTVNSLPNAPSGLRAFVPGSTVTLLWESAEDANQSVPLTYNVRLGTAPGLNDMVPSMSTTNGVRMLPAFGNAGFNTWMTLDLSQRPLPTNTLFWSVQAVDNSFQGGPFAAEQSFVLPSWQPGELPPPPELALRREASGRAALELRAVPHSEWQLEISEDLRTWLPYPSTSTVLRIADDGRASLEFTFAHDWLFIRARRLAP